MSLDKLDAARKHYEGIAAEAEVTIDMYLNFSVGIGENPNVKNPRVHTSDVMPYFLYTRLTQLLRSLSFLVYPQSNLKIVSPVLFLGIRE